MVKTANEDGSTATGDQIEHFFGISSAKGVFQCKYMSPGTYLLTVIFPGYTATPLKVYISAGVMTVVSIHLNKINT